MSTETRSPQTKKLMWRVVLIAFLLCFGGAALEAAGGPVQLGSSYSAILSEPPSGKPYIFPNPAVDFIELADVKGNVNAIRIYNLLGRDVLHFKVMEGAKYNVAKLPAGIYLVQMLDEKGEVISTQRMHKR